MDFATRACFALSRKLMKPPVERTVDYDLYADWRDESLSASWGHFDDATIAGKDVLDFGCGGGQLVYFLGRKKSARSIVGVDIDLDALARAQARLDAGRDDVGAVQLSFVPGSENGLPLGDASVDVVTAFDCLEHVMAPAPIMAEWFRVLRPGGRVLIEWFPFKGPWGPHMEALIPVPWAHVLFGERAMFRAAAELYDDAAFVPRHWDLDADGTKKPNKWRQWDRFADQAYVNELDVAGFRRLVRGSGLTVARMDRYGFGRGGGIKQRIGDALMALPVLGEYATSFAVIELSK
jgi:SAM-dependent methyltransferase